jgi:hypothetical protein
MSGTIDPNEMLTVTLPARELNSVFTFMAEGINAANAIMRNMQQQCLAQSERSYPPPKWQAATNRPNGEAHDARSERSVADAS